MNRKMKKFLWVAILFFSFNQIQAQVYLNELIYTPQAPRNDGGATAGEWIELYADAAIDISCYILTDGDWTITIPSGTTMAANSYYVIGRASFANTPGGNGTTAVDLDVETCGCTNGIFNMMDLDNGGEFVGLYDGVSGPATFVDGVIFESPTGANAPAGAGTINATSGAGTGCSTSITVNIAASAGSYEDAGAATGTPVGIGRESDGGGNQWDHIGTADASPGATNRGGALPVEFISFTAHAIDDNIKIDWATASELNNDYFVIEYGTNGAFEELTRVFGAGTTSEKQEYSFLHENVDNGTHYYRLKQVDFDGKYEYTDLVSVQLIYGDDLMVYPTVVEKSFTIQSDEEDMTGTQYEIYDITGRAIQSGDLTETTTVIDAERWEQGHYIVRIRQNGESVIKRVVK